MIMHDFEYILTNTAYQYAGQDKEDEEAAKNADKFSTSYEYYEHYEKDNSATQLFLSDTDSHSSHLKFETWYDPDVCHYLLQLMTNQAQCIRVIFLDANYGNSAQTFKKQLQQLIKLGIHLGRPAIFISKEPGDDNHFICGLVNNEKLLLINPLGITDKVDCYKTLYELKNENTIKNVWLSSNQLQRRDYEQNGLVSCGPITLALATHILTKFTPEKLAKFWSKWLQTSEPTKHLQSGLSYYGINIAVLLPDELKVLPNICNESNYKSSLLAIRNSHLSQLQNLPFEHANRENISVETCLVNCRERAPAQVVFNALMTSEKNIIDIMALPEYALFEQEISKKNIEIEIESDEHHYKLESHENHKVRNESSQPNQVDDFSSGYVGVFDETILESLPREFQHQLKQLLNKLNKPVVSTFMDFDEMFKKIKKNIATVLNELPKLSDENYEALLALFEAAESRFKQACFKQILANENVQYAIYSLDVHASYTKKTIKDRFIKIALCVRPDKDFYADSDKQLSCIAKALYNAADRLKTKLVELLEEKASHNPNNQYIFYRNTGHMEYQLALDYHRAIGRNYNYIVELKSEDLKKWGEKQLRKKRLEHALSAYAAYHQAFIIVCKHREIFLVDDHLMLQKKMAGCLYIIDRLLEAQLYCMGAIYMSFDLIDLCDQRKALNEVNNILNKIKNHDPCTKKEKSFALKPGSVNFSQALVLHPLNLPSKAMTIRERAIIRNALNENLSMIIRQIIIPPKTTTKIDHETIQASEQDAAVTKINGLIKQTTGMLIGTAGLSAGFVTVVLGTVFLSTVLPFAGVFFMITGAAAMKALYNTGKKLYLEGEIASYEPKLRHAYNFRIEEALKAFENEDYSKFIDLLTQPVDIENNVGSNLLSFTKENNIGLEAMIELMQKHGFRVDSIVYLALLIAEALTSRKIAIKHNEKESYMTLRELDHITKELYRQLIAYRTLKQKARILDRQIFSNAVKLEKTPHRRWQQFISSRFYGLPQSYFEDAEKLSFELRLQALINTARLNLAFLYLLEEDSLISQDRVGIPKGHKNAYAEFLEVRKYMSCHADWLQHNPFAQLMTARIEVLEDIFRVYSLDRSELELSLSVVPNVHPAEIFKQNLTLEEIEQDILQAQTHEEKAAAFYQKGRYYHDKANEMQAKKSFIHILRTWHDALSAYHAAVEHNWYTRIVNVDYHFGYIACLYHAGRSDMVLEYLEKWEGTLMASRAQYYLWRNLGYRRLGQHRLANLVIPQFYKHKKELETNFPQFKTELYIANRLSQMDCLVGKTPEEILCYYSEETSWKDELMRRPDPDHYFLLSIDGGGIRGILPAIWLSEIEKRTHQPIAHSFQSIAGTSTGAIIGGILSIPYSEGSIFPLYHAHELVKLYTIHGKDIFFQQEHLAQTENNILRLYPELIKDYTGHSKSVLPQQNNLILTWLQALGNRFSSKPKYNNASLIDLLNEKCHETKLSETLTELFITSVDESNPHETCLFTRKKAQGDSNENFNLKDILMATSAAPTFFAPYIIGNKGYIDGGVWQDNNPVQLAYDTLLENKSVSDSQNIQVVSMGTGEYIPAPLNPSKFRDQLFWTKKSPNRENAIHTMMKERLNTRYNRWQTPLPFPIGLDAVSDDDINQLVNTAEMCLEEWYAADDNAWNKQIEALSNNAEQIEALSDNEKQIVVLTPSM
ncbi:MAG: patatin-like phospholipase family protein [Gammaproteobacteria bacterium]|nr:patatin-like phospholipase family protein [Gammaproteobacteria bacterium]